ASIAQHAIQFSILVAIALFFLFENLQKGQFILSKYIHVLLTCFFTMFLFLLSSKLIITFYILYLVYFFVSFSRHELRGKWLMPVVLAVFFSIIGLVFLTKNPVSKR